MMRQAIRKDRQEGKEERTRLIASGIIQTLLSNLSKGSFQGALEKTTREIKK